MNYLITGGAGFIGGHLTEALLAEGESVTVIDNLSTGSRANLAAVADHPRLRFIEDDLLTMSGLDVLVAEHEVVYHLAAAVGVDMVVQDPIHTITTNVEASEKVLRATSQHRKRVILASTSEVYGKSTNAQFCETDDLLIGSPMHSRWSYACSKLLDEFYLMAHHQMNGMPGTVVRLFNTVGPRQTGRYGMVVPRMVQAALANRPMPVYGDGLQSRCFCHVFDTVRALRKLACCPASEGRIFNIGSQESITILALAQTVIEELKSSSPIAFIPYEDAYAPGFEDMRRRVPDTGAIRELLGWRPHYSLRQIIVDVAQSMRRAGGTA